MRSKPNSLSALISFDTAPLLITLATGLGYFMTYQFERGVCGGYDIPKTLISIELGNFLLFISACLVGVLLVLYLIQHKQIFQIPEGDNEKFDKGFGIYLVTGCLVLYASFYSDTPYRTMYIYAGTVVFAASILRWNYSDVKKTYERYRSEILIRFPAFPVYYIPGYIRDHLTSEEREDRAGTFKALTLMITINCLLIIWEAPYAYGCYDAVSKTHYSAMTNNRQLFLVRSYNQNLIFKRLVDGKFTKELVIIKQSDNGTVHLVDTVLDHSQPVRSNPKQPWE